MGSHTASPVNLCDQPVFRGKGIRLYFLEECQRVCGLCCKIVAGSWFYPHSLPGARDGAVSRQRDTDEAAGGRQERKDLEAGGCG